MIDRRWVGYGPPNYPFVLNRESSQAKGLVGWLPTAYFIANSLRDVLGSQYSFTGTVTSEFVSDLGNSYLYDGSTGFVDTKNYIQSTLSSFTVSFWMRDDETGTANRIPTGLNNAQNAVNIDTRLAGRTIRVRYINTLGSTEFLVGITQVGNVTRHISLTVKGTDAILYIDGIPDATTSNYSISNSFVGNGILRIGSRTNSTSFWNGIISDYRIYNRALTPIEVYQLYAPQTRWELYQPMQRASLAFVVPAGLGPVYPGRNHPSRNVLLRL